MCAKLRVVVLARLGRRYEIALLAQIVGAAHANKAAFRQVVFFFRTQRDRVDQHRQVMSVAADDLDELILAFLESPIIDAARILFAESIFAALRNKAAAVASVLAIKLFFVFVSDRRAVDDHVGALDCLLRFKGGLHSHLDEFLPTILVNREFRSLLTGNDNF